MRTRTAKQVFTELFDGRHRTIRQVWGEIVEAWEAWRYGNKPLFELEAQQVWFELQMQVYRITAIDFTLRGCQEAVQTFYARRVVWAHIFQDVGAVFKGEYLRDGSNYRKPWKVKQALAYAGVELTNKQAIEVCERRSWLLAPTVSAPGVSRKERRARQRSK